MASRTFRSLKNGADGGIVVPAEIEVGPFDAEDFGVFVVEIGAVGLAGPLLLLDFVFVDAAGFQRQQRGVGIFDDAEFDFVEVRFFADLLAADACTNRRGA